MGSNISDFSRTSLNSALKSLYFFLPIVSLQTIDVNAAPSAPADAATGTVLTASGGGDLPPAPLGNAGLAQSTGTGSIAALLLAAFAVVVVAGGRAASRTR